MRRVLKKGIFALFTILMFMMVVMLQIREVHAANTNINNATQVSFGTTYKDNITTDIPTRYYKIVLLSSGEVSFHIQGENKWLALYLYDSMGKEVEYVTKSKSSVTDKVVIEESYHMTGGTYYFAIDGFAPLSGVKVGAYQYLVNFVSANESFPETGNGSNNNTSSANKVSIGTTYRGQIAITDSIDYYVFSIPSSGKVTLHVEGDNSFLHTFLYDSAGEELKHIQRSKSDVTNKTTVDEDCNLTAGTYYLAIDGEHNYRRQGNYQIKLDFISANESFVETHKDDNISGANEIAFNTDYCGQISLDNDVDYYKFTVSKRDSIAITASMEDIGRVYIYNVQGKELWEKNISDDTQSGNYTLSHNVEISPGTYYLRIACIYQSGGNYSFKLTSYNATRKPAKVIISGAKSAKKKTAVISWKKISGVDGYQIQYAKSKKFSGKKTVNAGKTTAKRTIKKLPSKKKYYVRIRAYKTIAGKNKYGSWSKVKSVKVK
ncbi:MAG: fibronectin type III domain-containing protein [Lachnospiraceae bacterium]|nr:fibronectin type III domain-containing protein [Lachnospiraceae bacterium]